MKKNQNLFNISLLCFLMVTLNSSCIMLVTGAAVQKKASKFSVSDGSIPPEFKESNSVLLAMRPGDKVSAKTEKNYTKYLIKNFEAYEGKYEILDPIDLEKKKYDDLDEFRYIFDFYYVYTEHSNGDTNRSKQFYILDRKTEKKYKATFHSGLFSKVMKGYIISLNKELN